MMYKEYNHKETKVFKKTEPFHINKQCKNTEKGGAPDMMIKSFYEKTELSLQIIK